MTRPVARCQTNHQTLADPPGSAILASQDVRIRIGTAFTRSREDRFSNRDQTSPENTSLSNSDGVLAFSTGALAAGVTIDQAAYRMWAADAGIT